MTRDRAVHPVVVGEVIKKPPPKRAMGTSRKRRYPNPSFCHPVRTLCTTMPRPDARASRPSAVRRGKPWARAAAT